MHRISRLSVLIQPLGFSLQAAIVRYKPRVLGRFRRALRPGTSKTLSLAGPGRPEETLNFSSSKRVGA